MWKLMVVDRPILDRITKILPCNVQFYAEIILTSSDSHNGFLNGL